MLSQVLFGEKYKIIDHSGKWIKVETLFDNYHGWLDLDHLQHSESDNESRGFVLNRTLVTRREDRTSMVLEAGSEIYEPDFDAGTFSAGKNKYSTSSAFKQSYVSVNESLSDTALRFINCPYIWGGRIPSGIDCSGFTQLIYKIHGLPIPRNSWQQAEVGSVISFINETKTGDLVFFDNEKGQITHVGMILSEGLVIHASGRVRIDTIDHQGIFKYEIGNYSHHLRLIKRI